MLKLLLPLLVLGTVVGASVLTDDPRPRADLTIINSREPSSLDFHTASWMNDLRVIRCLSEGLVRLDTRGPESRIAPGVAERWEVSADGLEYTFRLRADARWTNGEPVRAGDFVYAWRRALLPETGCDYVTFFHLIRGGREFTAWRKAATDAFGPRGDAAGLWAESCRRFAETVGVRAADDRTLVVTLERPVAYFLDACALPAMNPLYGPLLDRYERPDPATGLVRSSSEWQKPGVLVGNGPFRLAQWRFRRDMRLERSPHYWDPGRVPCGSIAILSVEDPNAQVLAFRSGAVDWVSDVSAPYRADMLADKLAYLGEHRAEVERMRAEGLSPIEIDRRLPADPRRCVQAFPAAGTYFYNFNCLPTMADGRPNPFADAGVRRAFAMAVDRERIASQVRRLGERPATVLIPPGAMKGYAGPAGLRYDPEGARRALAAAGHPGGAGLPTIEILYNAEGGHDHIAQAVKKDWETTLGVSVALVQKETKAFRADLKRQNFMASRAGWFADYNDPTTFLDIMRAGDGNNDRKYASPRFEAIMGASDLERDPAKRMALLAEAERVLVQEDLPCIPMFHYVQMYLFDPGRLEGVSTQPKQEQPVHEFGVLGR